MQQNVRYPDNIIRLQSPSPEAATYMWWGSEIIIPPSEKHTLHGSFYTNATTFDPNIFAQKTIISFDYIPEMRIGHPNYVRVINSCDGKPSNIRYANNLSDHDITDHYGGGVFVMGTVVKKLPLVEETEENSNERWRVFADCRYFTRQADVNEDDVYLLTSHASIIPLNAGLIPAQESFLWEKHGDIFVNVEQDEIKARPIEEQFKQARDLLLHSNWPIAQAVAKKTFDVN